MRKIILLLMPVLATSQVSIDSLGVNLGKDNYVLIEAANKTKNEIYMKAIEFLKGKSNVNILDSIGSDKLIFKISDNYVSYLRRTGKDGHIGSDSTIEIEFKDGKFRIVSIKPEMFLIYGPQIEKPKKVESKKKKPFSIAGKGTSLYNNDLILRKAGRMAKPKIERYYNDFIYEIKSFIIGDDKW